MKCTEFMAKSQLFFPLPDGYTVLHFNPWTSRRQHTNLFPYLSSVSTVANSGWLTGVHINQNSKIIKNTKKARKKTCLGLCTFGSVSLLIVFIINSKVFPFRIRTVTNREACYFGYVTVRLWTKQVLLIVSNKSQKYAKLFLILKPEPGNRKIFASLFLSVCSEDKFETIQIRRGKDSKWPRNKWLDADPRFFKTFYKKDTFWTFQFIPHERIDLLSKKKSHILHNCLSMQRVFWDISGSICRLRISTKL